MNLFYAHNDDAADNVNNDDVNYSMLNRCNQWHASNHVRF